MISSLDRIADEVRKLQAGGRKVVFTNGCFDLLHSGHIEILRKSRSFGDALVVAINTDDSVSRMKSSRPIVPQAERAELLDSLEMVDFVTAFAEDTPLEAILKIQPDVLVKGAEWTGNVVGQKEVESWGGQVMLLPLVPGHSTTDIIQRVISRYGNARKTNS